MAQYFEVSIITNKRAELDAWSEFSLFTDDDIYNGSLEFFRNN